MNLILKYTGIFALAMVLSSFSISNSETPLGTYGVSSSDPSQIKLIIHSDHSFYFQDLSVPKNKITVNGQWKLNGNKVILTASNSTVKFHNVWTIEAKGKNVRSRKGLSFYRLCKVD